jgi:hypothetical protein
MANGSQYSDPTPLVSVETLTKRYPDLVSGIDQSVLSDIVVEATAHIEDMCGRRLAPFTGYVESMRLEGVDPDEYGSTVQMPVDIYASLGMSYANAMGSQDMVRHFLVSQYAPMYPELWTYNVHSIVVYTTYGTAQSLNLTNLLGPDPTDGHVWMRLGTFAPIGSRVTITYDGGYTVATPPALARAALFQTAKFIILETEPQQRRGMDLTELEDTINKLMGPWMKS